MTLLNHRAAFDYVKSLLNTEKGFRVCSTTPQNKGRHELVQVEDAKGFRGYFYLVFKHTFFHSFNYVDSDFVINHPEYEGQGESLNVEWLALARRWNATILYVYPDMKVYMIHSVTLQNFVSEHQLVRDQERTNEYKEVDSDGGVMQVIKNERTAFFPIKILSRWN